MRIRNSPAAVCPYLIEARVPLNVTAHVNRREDRAQGEDEPEDLLQEDPTKKLLRVTGGDAFIDS